MKHLDEIDADFFLSLHSSIGYIKPNDIAVGCAICNEDSSFGKKHRLHLNIKNNYEKPHVKCFNCDWSSSLYVYIKEHHPQRLSEYKELKKSENFNKIISLRDMIKPNKPNKPNNPKEHINEDTNGWGIDLNNIKPIKTSKDYLRCEEYPNLNLIEPLNFSETFPLDCLEYLKKRGLKPQKHWRFSPKSNKITFNSEEIYLSEFIIIPLMIDNLWYGFQALAYKEKKFFVYLVHGNSSWKVENWNNIDKSKEVYIFESIYDRISSGLTNSIAVLGANLHEDRLKELKKPIFCLDNFHVDKKALEETKKYLKRGFSCLIWTKNMTKYKDTNDMRKVGISTELISKYILKNIKSCLRAEMELRLL